MPYSSFYPQCDSWFPISNGELTEYTWAFDGWLTDEIRGNRAECDLAAGHPNECEMTIDGPGSNTGAIWIRWQRNPYDDGFGKPVLHGIFAVIRGAEQCGARYYDRICIRPRRHPRNGHVFTGEDS